MDSFLEEEVYSDLSPANFYTSETDAIAAVSAVYNNLQVYGNEWWPVGVVFMSVTDGTTDIMNPLWYQQYEKLNYSSNDGGILDLWRWIYNLNNNANYALDALANIEMDPDLKARLIAETKFLRALGYFYAVQWWGDIPYIEDPIKSFDDIVDFERTPKAEVYNKIIADLEDAMNVLPMSYDASEAGRVTKGAAKALLGKVLLTRGWGGSPSNINTADFQAAVQHFEELMSAEYPYMLADSLVDVFDYTKENSPELGHIFSVQYSTGLGFEGTWLAQNMQAMELENAWWGYAAPESWVQGPDGFEIFWKDGWEPNPVDKRLKYVWEDYLQLWWYYWCKKWQYDNYLGWAEHPQNMTLLRYADVLLMHSEALNELNGGPDAAVVESINKVRVRAGVAPYNPADWTQETFRDEIQDERNRELWGEGHSWFDYVRKGMFVERMNAVGYNHVTDDFNLLPIPRLEIENNPALTQNTGW
jgi:hypothetical protein